MEFSVVVLVRRIGIHNIISGTSGAARDGIEAIPSGGPEIKIK